VNSFKNHTNNTLYEAKERIISIITVIIKMIKIIKEKERSNTIFVYPVLFNHDLLWMREQLFVPLYQ
jgi:hypothetical protein